ncbi:MFS transporter [Candidatus Chlorohelix sp.]|uniref:MFS transporter n=1 Tax=Candidatus Chlorohelix sp. TaxID=3139201 RepID=UPI00304343DB
MPSKIEKSEGVAIALEETGNASLVPNDHQLKRLLKAALTYFARGGAALHHRNYRLFFFGQLVSLIGTWMQNLAQGWLVLKITNDPMALGLVTALQFLPVLCLTLFGGIIADRLPKRRTLLLTQTLAMSLAFILATLVSLNIVQLWEIYVMATLLGLVNAIDMPVRQSFVSEMVGKEELMNAVALNSSIFNAARVVGPAVAGLLIGWVGIAPAFWLNGFSFVAVLTGLFLMRESELFVGTGKRPTGKIFKHLKEGLGYTFHTPAVYIIMILVGIVGLLGVNFNVWIPVLANNYLKVGAEGYGILMSGIGIGALGRALTLAMAGKKPKHLTLLKGAFLFSLFGLGVALSPFFWVSLALMVGLGASMSNVMASANTLVQLITPDNLRGRVMSLYMLVFAGTTPIGGLLAGWLASAGGTPFSMGVCMVLSLMAVPITWVLMKKNRESLESL